MSIRQKKYLRSQGELWLGFAFSGLMIVGVAMAAGDENADPMKFAESVELEETVHESEDLVDVAPAMVTDSSVRVADASVDTELGFDALPELPDETALDDESLEDESELAATSHETTTVDEDEDDFEIELSAPDQP